MPIPLIRSATEYLLPPSTSPCGRNLHFGGRIARHFVNIPTSLLNITVLALGVLSCIAFYKIEDALLTRASQLLFPLPAGKVLFLGAAAMQFLAMWHFINKIIDKILHMNIYNEILGQKNERKVIEALGGQKTLTGLPQIKDPYGRDWNSIRPEDLENLPVSIETGEHFTVALCLREKNNPAAQPFALALGTHLQYYMSIDGWQLLGPNHPNGIFEDGRYKPGDFSFKPLEKFLSDLRLLIQRQHPKYELV